MCRNHEVVMEGTRYGEHVRVRQPLIGINVGTDTGILCDFRKGAAVRALPRGSRLFDRRPLGVGPRRLVVQNLRTRAIGGRCSSAADRRGGGE
jgi:hypothetical protein